jgi:hypothetical protein
VAGLYHTLGGLEHTRGRHALSEPLARRAVVLRLRALGEDNPAVAADRAPLAALLDGQDKDDEAERLYRQAVAVFVRAFGPCPY